ncbi:MAG: hypothetical protein LBD80_01715 [Tannerella sp.]|nr:hypothetical protein [Tannerella sp.]
MSKFSRFFSNEKFPFGGGTIVGIIMSLIGTFLFLPLFMGVAKPAI